VRGGKSIRKFLAAVGGWMLICLLALYGLNLSGFCCDTLIFVTDDELLAMATSDEYVKHSLTIGGPKQARAYPDAHPGCCAVHRWRESFHVEPVSRRAVRHA
jgi:hypothetical protein